MSEGWQPSPDSRLLDTTAGLHLARDVFRVTHRALREAPAGARGALLARHRAAVANLRDAHHAYQGCLWAFSSARGERPFPRPVGLAARTLKQSSP